MKGFILGFLLASALGAGLVWAQNSTIYDQYGQYRGYIQPNAPMPQQDFMGPARGMGQQLQGILNNQRSPC